VQFCVPDDGRKNRLKYVERLTEINKLRNFASCWLYYENILAMHGPMIVKKHSFNINVFYRRRLKQPKAVHLKNKYYFNDKIR